MENTIKNSIIFKRFYAELVDKYGTDKAKVIWDYAEDEFSRLKIAEPSAGKESVAYVFPAVALYRSVEHFYPGEALSVTRGFGTKMGRRLKDIFRGITALPGIPSLMWERMDRISAKLSDGYEIKNLKVTTDKCYMDVVSCPLYDKALKLGTPEAVQMICCMDKEYMNGFRGVDYKRTKSVAEGDDCCDYRLRKTMNMELKEKTIKTLKKKQVFRRELEKQLSKPEADKIWRDAHKRLYGLYKTHRDLPKGVAMHTDTFIFPAAAIYLAMKEFDKDFAYDTMQRIMGERSKAYGKKLAMLCRVPGFDKMFIKIWDSMTRKVFGESSGFKNVFYPKEKDLFRMDITQCPYNKYLTEAGCPEINILFCKNDEYMYGNLPGLRFTRTGTIGAGNRCCDFKLELL